MIPFNDLVHLAITGQDAWISHFFLDGQPCDETNRGRKTEVSESDHNQAFLRISLCASPFIISCISTVNNRLHFFT